MNDIEIAKVIDAMNDHNPKPLGVLACAALERDLPDLEFAVVMARLVDAAAKEKYLAASDVLAAGKPSMYGAADRAWAEISSTAARSGGMFALIANIDAVEWGDRIARLALIDARRAVKAGTEETAMWAFRKAYNRLAEDDQGLAGGAPTVALPAGHQPQAVDAPRSGSVGKINLPAVAARMTAEFR